MIVTGYIFLPFFSLPSLWVLKKPLQIKLLFFLVGLIHLLFGLGLLTQHGYLFENKVLQESLSLMKYLGFNYTVSLGGLSLLTATAVSLLFMFFGTFSLNESFKYKAVLMTIMQPLAFLVLFSENLLLTILALFSFVGLSSILSNKERGYIGKKTFVFFLSFSLLMMVSLVFGVLYESIHTYADLDLSALGSMRTPFVKGSLYSTQFVLASSFLFGCLSLLLLSLGQWISCLKQRGNTILFWIPILLCGVTVMNYFTVLFPEVNTVYFSDFNLNTLVQRVCILTFAVSVFFEVFFYVRSNRRSDV